MLWSYKEKKLIVTIPLVVLFTLHQPFALPSTIDHLASAWLQWRGEGGTNYVSKTNRLEMVTDLQAVLDRKAAEWVLLYSPPVYDVQHTAKFSMSLE